jgi:hypothetical protein
MKDVKVAREHHLESSSELPFLVAIFWVSVLPNPDSLPKRNLDLIWIHWFYNC